MNIKTPKLDVEIRTALRFSHTSLPANIVTAGSVKEATELLAEIAKVAVELAVENAKRVYATAMAEHWRMMADEEPAGTVRTTKLRDSG